MSYNSPLHAQLRRILSEVSRRSCTDIGLDDDLFSVGILDSFGTIEFVLVLEKHFHCAIPQDELIPQNLWSIRAISDMLYRLGGGAAS